MYKPEQRVVPARILTLKGWLTGSFHVGSRVQFVEYLSNAASFVALTDVAMDGQSWEHLSLMKDSIVMVLPSADEALSSALPNHSPRKLQCLVGNGDVVGTTSVLTSLRISDFFANPSDFIHLRDCTLRNDRKSPETQACADVMIRTVQIFGVSQCSAEEDREPVGVGETGSEV